MEALTELKAGQRKMWATGDYPAVASKISDVGRRIVSRLEIAPGERVLDVACGDGNATLPAAKTGARVTGLDLTPELLEAGRKAAEGAGLEIDWVEGDAEALPFADDSFDVVVSTFGCMFAPDHAQTAREIARVLAPGGRIGLCCWTPEGSIGEMFRTVSTHAPPPPEVAASPPPLWGTEAHVLELFEGTGVQVDFEREEVEWSFDSIDGAVDFYATNFGPIVMARARLEPEGKWQALLDDLHGWIERNNIAEGDEARWQGQYLVTLGHRP